MGLIQNKVTVSQPNSHVVVKNAGGLRGLTGETGPQGPQGVPGDAATVTAGTTTTLPAGSDATVQNVGSTSAAIFNFGIPKGDKGDTGESGAAATISVGSTSTLPAGSSATVTNSGTSSAAVFDFGIPKGDKGDTGATGADGYSPSATVTKTGDTATITITDKDGTTTASISDGSTPTVNDGTLTIQKNGTTVQTFSADQASNVTANITVPTQFSELSGTVSSSQIEDEAITTGSVSGTGTNITLEGTMEGGAIESVELKGDTEQTTYSGKNLVDLVPITNVSSNYSQGVTLETVADATIGRNVLHIVSTTGYPSVVYNLNQRLQSGKYYALKFTYKSAFAGTNNNRKAMWFAPSWTTNNWDNLGSLGSSNSKGGDGITSNLVQQSTEWVTRSVRFYVTPTQYESVEASYSKLMFSLGYGISGEGCTDKELWLADVMLYEITEPEWNATNYTSPDYEPYVGGTASPNPDYPQEVKTVTGEQTIEVHGKNFWTSGLVVGGIGSNNSALNRKDRYNTNSYVKVLPSTVYTFSCDSSVSGKTPQVFFLAYRDDYSYIGQLPSNDWYGVPLTIKTTADTYYLKMSGRYSDDSTIGTVGSTTTAITNIQLELGSSATTYEPYKGVTKTVNLGKNLLPFTNQNFTKNNVTFSVTDGTLYLNGTSTGEVLPGNQTWKDNFAFTLQPGTYTLSLNIAVTASYINKMSDNTTLATVNGNSTKKATFTITEPTEVYLGFYMYNLSFSNLATTYQLEKGSTATTYAPYFTPIELCKIGTYQDYIYKSGEDWYLHKETGKINLFDYIDTGWYGSAYSGVTHVIKNLYTNLGITNIVKASDSAHLGIGYSDFFTMEIVNDLYRGKKTDGFCIGADGLYFSNNDWSVNEFKTFITNNTVYVYYALATPTDTQITNAALISELEDLLSATTYSGTTYITVSGDLAIPLEVVAEADSKLAPDSVYGAAIKDGAVSVDKIADLKALADALAPYLNS